MEIIGHQKIINILTAGLENNNITHAYLFTGPKSLGKFMIAKMFALALIEGNKKLVNPMTVGVNLDLIILKPEIEEKDGIVKEKDIPIEAVRDIQAQLALFPQAGLKRGLIVDGAEFLTQGAQNALLKTLEEPNSTSVIILVVHDESLLLSTIKSRCQGMRFSLVDQEDLQQAAGERENQQELVSLSAGRPGILLKMKEDREFFEDRKSMRETLERAVGGGLNEKFSLAQEFSKNVPRAEEHLEFWLALLRETANKYGWGSVARQMEAIGDALETIRQTNANVRLVLENLFINLS
jgi:DNA polymerase-3 subunit delta'